jgi:hypothetical protein
METVSTKGHHAYFKQSNCFFHTQIKKNNDSVLIIYTHKYSNFYRNYQKNL